MNHIVLYKPSPAYITTIARIIGIKLYVVYMNNTDHRPLEEIEAICVTKVVKTCLNCMYVIGALI